jgi:exodeoxyribonuclease III
VRIVSWNVNGLRAVVGKGFGEFVARADADLICLQEIKARAEQVTFAWPEGYEVFWNSADRPGYSGTLTATRRKPLSVSTGIGEAEGDAEGRVQTLEFPAFYLVNVYTPNAGNELARLGFRTRRWDRAFRLHCAALAERKPVVFCGDLNVAHEEIDLANPRTNRKNAGFTDEERAEFTAHLGAGFIDSFRHLHPGKREAYSWWSFRSGARARNVGWRIDYVCLSASLAPSLRDAFIWPDVLGSDHCPVGVELDL